MDRFFLQAKYMPPRFWDEVVYGENYLLKFISTQVIPSMNPVEQWCGKNPLVGHLCVFGCVSLVHIYDDYRNKLDAKSYACIMIGYSEESKAYQLFDPVK
jgi:hypothetical protein